jgi:uncharacterized integral membrane protein
MTDRNQSNDGISPRFWIGILIVVLIGVFIALNREQANVSLVFANVTMPLWVALTISAVLGFVAGWLIGRRRR